MTDWSAFRVSRLGKLAIVSLKETGKIDMKRLAMGLLAVLLAGCVIPVSIEPDRDCSNFRERVNEMKYMTDLYATVVDGRSVLDEDAARGHGFSEKSIALTRDVLMWRYLSLYFEDAEDVPVKTEHVKWLLDCSAKYEE